MIATESTQERRGAPRERGPSLGLGFRPNVTERVEARVSGLERGSWAVIVDADETVLDNSEYQLRRSRQGLGYTSDSWAVWVREAAAMTYRGLSGASSAGVIAR